LRQAAILADQPGGTAKIKEMMRQSGVRVDSEWCADFVTYTLKARGLPIPEGNYSVASTYQRYGTSVPPGEVKAGDILTRSDVPYGSTGGHVQTVLETDPTKGIHVVQGNTFKEFWEKSLPRNYMARRPPGPEGTTQVAGPPSASIPTGPTTPSSTAWPTNAPTESLNTSLENLDRSALDKNMANEVTHDVDTSGKITVTHEDAGGGTRRRGYHKPKFKDTPIGRQTQMQPADHGPAAANPADEVPI
jgi:hypothetical protein